MFPGSSRYLSLYLLVGLSLALELQLNVNLLTTLDRLLYLSNRHARCVCLEIDEMLGVIKYCSWLNQFVINAPRG